MKEVKQQSFRSHASKDSAFVFFLLPALLVNLILGIVILVMNLHSQLILSLWIVILSFAMCIVAMKLRSYPLKVQDRVIRLEERLRLAALLPEPLKKRIPELSADQLVGLRYASDAEIASLVELTLEKDLDRKQIKERIQTWRPDYFRI